MTGPVAVDAPATLTQILPHLQTLARETLSRAASQTAVTVMPGTVATYKPGDPTATVILDDPSGVNQPATMNVVGPGGGYWAGQRVMVLLYPPHGSLVLGPVNAGGWLSDWAGPWGYVGRSVNTGAATGITGSEVSVVLDLKVPLVHNRRYKISSNVRNMVSTVANDVIELRIKQDGVVLAGCLGTAIQANVGAPQPSPEAWISNATDVASVFSLVAIRLAGTGTCTVDSGGYTNFLGVEDLGAFGAP